MSQTSLQFQLVAKQNVIFVTDNLTGKGRGREEERKRERVRGGIKFHKNGYDKYQGFKEKTRTRFRGTCGFLNFCS